MEPKTAGTPVESGIPPEQASKKHIPALDGVRALAIAVVFLYHYGGGKQSSLWIVRLFANTINFGWAGVSLFFVLSGFLITGILWDSFSQPGWWSRFYIRRSLRIFPLYYFALLIALVVALVAKFPPHPVPGLLVYVFYLQDIPVRIFDSLTYPLINTICLGHLWSLAVEEQFYLIWPALLFLFARNRRAALRMIVFLWMLSFAFRLAVIYFHLPIDWALESIMGRSGELLAGSYLALLVRGTRDERARIETVAPYLFTVSAAAFIALATYIVWSGQDIEGSERIICGTGLAILSIASPAALLLAMDTPLLGRCLSAAPLQWIGKISYGLYVYHFLFRIQYQQLATYLAPHLSPTAHLVFVDLIAFVATLAIATVSYYTIEVGFLRLKPILAGTKQDNRQLAASKN